MPSTDNITILKGGSLNSTCLHENSMGKFVRKKIATDKNREYGYVRWYSQLKKLQRYNSMFPGFVPKVLDAGVNDNEAYFDIEYIDGIDIKTLFKNNLIDDVEKLNQSLWEAFDLIHHRSYSPLRSSLMLYFMEEVEQKLHDALEFPEFRDFYMMDVYEYRGETFRGMIGQHDKFKKLFNRDITSEGYVHGNPTLENILYNTDTNKITFIDLYEEGIVDSRYSDYSQVLQCSNSHYGLINDSIVTINDNQIMSDYIIPDKLAEFNSLFIENIEDNTSLVMLFEATQYFRMLPFKCHSGNISHAKFFYGYGCYLVNKLL